VLYSKIGNPAAGNQVSQFLMRVRVEAGPGGAITPDNAPNSLVPDGTPYSLVGNAPC
jgi:hypothetical protein